MHEGFENDNSVVRLSIYFILPKPIWNVNYLGSQQKRGTVQAGDLIKAQNF